MKELVKQIQTFISKGNPNKNEIELRFNEPTVRHSVSKDTFLRVLDHCKKSSLWKNDKKTKDKVIIGESLVKGKPNMRRIETSSGVIYQTKTRQRVEDNREFNIRLSEATELTHDIDQEEWDTKYIPTMERSRERVSFMDINDVWRIDITFVNMFDKSGNEAKIYEVEMEYTKKGNLLGIAKITDFIMDILSTIQNSSSIISASTIQMLIQNYARLLDMNPRYPSFVGPLPFTLTKDIFETGRLACGFSVTEKADGDRKLLYIGQGGNALLISRPKDKILQHSHIGVFPEFENSIFDGEYIEKTNTIYLFDTLVYKSKNMRDYPLDIRLERLYKLKIVESPKLNINLEIKTFYMAVGDIIQKIENGIKTEEIPDKTIYSISGDIWKNKNKFPYDLDGLIYTPINKPYFNKSIFKWKESNTIDFYVEFISKTTWKLFVSGLNDKNEYTHIPFEGTKSDGKIRLRKEKSSETELIDNLIWGSDSPLKEGVIEVSKALAAKFKTDTIIEFKYYGGKFLPIKTRVDKKNANNIRAVNDAWISMTNALTMSILQKGIYKSCIRAFHNAIKNDLIKKMSHSKHILDIGSGAGGDINKYVDAQVKSLVGIDIVDVEYKHPKYMKFYKVDTELYDIANLLKHTNVTKFDTINCHFAMHYFFKSEETFDNFIKNINNTIKKGGSFVTTFMDGSKVNNLLNSNGVTKGKILTAKFRDTSIYKIKKNYKDTEDINTLPLFDQKIEVNLCGTKYFKCKTSIEYLVNTKAFVKKLTDNGFKVTFVKSFESMCKHFPYECMSMNSVEKEFSFLNSFIIATKV